MSDGNFNRALLPSSPYGSGVKAGRAQERQRALAAFGAWLRAMWPEMSEEELAQHERTFHERLTTLTP